MPIYASTKDYLLQVYDIRIVFANQPHAAGAGIAAVSKADFR